jgi:lysozyme family protein
MKQLDDFLKALSGMLTPEAPTKVYDSMRPSATVNEHVDEESMVKVEDIKVAMNDLVVANSTETGDVATALDKIADPNVVTKLTAEVDSYGLTKEQRRYLLEYIFLVEGGYFNHPNDPGGETMYGIIKTEARANGYNGAMRDLPREVACEIYLRKYWKNNGLMKIESFIVGLCIFDFFVNSGSRGATIAQETVNAVYTNRTGSVQFGKSADAAGLKPIAVDGQMGDKTFGAINKIPPYVFISIYNVLQEDKYEDLMRNNGKLRSFDKGWENRIHRKIIFIYDLIARGVDVMDFKYKK